MPKEVIKTKDWHGPSWVTTNGNLVFIAGVGRAGDDTPTQMRTALESIKSKLEQIGSSIENVMFALVFLRDLWNRERYLNKIWKEYFPRDGDPLRMCVGADLHPAGPWPRTSEPGPHDTSAPLEIEIFAIAQK